MALEDTRCSEFKREVVWALSNVIQSIQEGTSRDTDAVPWYSVKGKKH